MRRLCILLILYCGMTARTLCAADGKVIKTLPEYLDAKDRASIAPSLYERDAYQAWLRKHPTEQAGLSLEVQWKASGVDWSKTKLRAEMRGVLENTSVTKTLEIPVKKSGLFSTWTEFKLKGDDFHQLGKLVAWRVTLWEGDKQVAEQESFLWSGVGPKN
jgi:hypothetical protein